MLIKDSSKLTQLLLFDFLIEAKEKFGMILDR